MSKIQFIPRLGNFFLAFFWFFALSSSVYSQTNTVFSGNWSSPVNWSNNVPSVSSIADINHPMTLDIGLVIGNSGYFSINESAQLISNNSYDIQLVGNGVFDVDGNVEIQGNLSVDNTASLFVRSYDTLIVGSAEFTNSAVIVIEKFGVMIVNGDLDLRNNNSSTLNGNLYVNGNVFASNSSKIVGTGSMEATGKVYLDNNTSILGSTKSCLNYPCEYGSGNALPVQLTHFEAKDLKNGKIELEWGTETELYSDYFVVEQSVDAFHFEELAVVEAAGNSLKNQNYSIQTQAVQTINYFRLIQVDQDGAKRVFNPIVIEVSIIHSENEWNFYPNPITNGEPLSFKLSNSTEVNFQLVEIRDIHGRLLLSQNVVYGLNNIPTENLPNGVYFLYLNGKSDNTRKLIIEK